MGFQCFSTFCFCVPSDRGSALSTDDFTKDVLFANVLCLLLLHGLDGSPQAWMIAQSKPRSITQELPIQEFNILCIGPDRPGVDSDGGGAGGERRRGGAGGAPLKLTQCVIGSTDEATTRYG